MIQVSFAEEKRSKDSATHYSAFSSPRRRLEEVRILNSPEPKPLLPQQPVLSPSSP
jgi:hypothetical protein